MTGWSNGNSFSKESLSAARTAQELWIFRLMRSIQDRGGL